MEGLLCHRFTNLPEAIIGNEDRNEVPFTIARATPCEVRFGLFLAQIAPSLQNKKTRKTRKFAFGFGQTRRSTAFSILVLLTTEGA